MRSITASEFDRAKRFIELLSDEDLKQFGRDIISLHKTGILPRDILSLMLDAESLDIRIAENLIKDEILKRYCNYSS